MITKLVVGFCGLKGSGKDTAANVLIDQGFENIKFADPLKNAIRAILRTAGVNDVMIERMVEGDLKEMAHPVWGGKSTRYVMQTMGTEWGRMMIWPAIWTNIWTMRTGRILRVTTTDVRFLNEADTIRGFEKQGVTVKIVKLVRPEKLDINAPAKALLDNHQSEIELSRIRCDFEIRNTGTIEDLQKAVLDFVGTIIL